FASQTTVDMFIKNYSSENPKDIERFLESTFDEINKYIYFKKVSEYDKAMLGCTAVVMIVERETAHIAHLGDSRAYIVQEDRIQKLTIDHSYVQSLVDKGEILQENAKFHSKRHVLIQALGSHRRARIDYTTRSIASSETLMLCSDGVWGFVSQSKIEEILINNDSNQATKKIIDLVKKNSGTDNITLQVISLI
ncbi:MAG: hypothetical protein MUP82_02450, partial [Candidatus Marinimicrobia bacterium]|nr:hypothetical protein [Candidatus Neomarinimicrobiota bacterium]